eukprot:Clim_evm8s16 gene=Clim_evmTU8s16
MDNPNVIYQTRIVVDCFKQNRKPKGIPEPIYVLSHFHADHYGGVTNNWNRGLIWCSTLTGSLLVNVLGVEEQYVRQCELGTPVELPDSTEATFLDANHCPGAAMILFRVRNENSSSFTCHLHCGDFRYHPFMKNLAQLAALAPESPQFSGTRLDRLYLDTTYCNPRFDLPDQVHPIEFVARTADEEIRSGKEKGERTLVLIATYVIGKEKILLRVHEQTGHQLHVSDKKMKILQLLGYASDEDQPNSGQNSPPFTQSLDGVPIHVVSWGFLGEMAPGGWTFLPNWSVFREMLEHYQGHFERIVAFVPTGWTYTMKSSKRDENGVVYNRMTSEDLNAVVYTVPYSEHSSFGELREFVGFLKPTRVVPTVFGRSVKPEKLKRYFRDLVNIKSAHANLFAGARDEKSEPLTCVENGKEDSDTANVDAQRQSKRPRVENGDESDPQENRNDENYDGDNMTAVMDIVEERCAGDNKENAQLPTATSTNTISTTEAEAGTAECPVCQQDMPLASINEHIDECLTRQAITLDKVQGKNEPADVSDQEQDSPILRGSTIEELRALVPDIKESYAQSLLLRANGNLELAMNYYFNDESGITIDLAPRTQPLSQASEPQAPRTNGTTPRSLKKVAATSGSNTANTNRGSGSSESHTLDSLFGSATKCNSGSMEEKSSVSQSSQANTTPTKSMGNTSNDQNALNIDYSPGEPVPYATVAHAFEILEKEQGRRRITQTLTSLFAEIMDKTPEDLLPCVYLCSNRIAPAYTGLEIGIGGSLVSQCVREVTNRSRNAMRADYAELGDLGDVAYRARSQMKVLFPTKPLTVRELYKNLLRMARMKGSGVQNDKKNIVKKMLVACRGVETKFLVRTLIQHIRTGATATTALHALSGAFLQRQARQTGSVVPAERLAEGTALLKDAFSQCPSFDKLVPALMECSEIDDIRETCRMRAGIPIKPMLGTIIKDLAGVLKRVGHTTPIACDWKFDGMRAQIHLLENGNVRVFSRHLEEATERFPDVCLATQNAARSHGVSSCILDAEIVAVELPKDYDDSKSGSGGVPQQQEKVAGKWPFKILPFQQLSSRPRKNVAIENIKIKVCVFAFDLMLLNGESLLQRTFRERRDAMYAHFDVTPGVFDFVKQRVINPKAMTMAGEEPAEALQACMVDAFAENCEGVMVKPLDFPTVDGRVSNADDPDFKQTCASTYQPAKRCGNWMKVKRDYLEGMADSLDLVPIGGWWGNGRKAGWISPYLLATYDADTDTYYTVCKCISGFSDAFYKESLKFYMGDKDSDKNDENVADGYSDGVDDNRNRLLGRRPENVVVTDALTPSFWFDPCEVWELRGAEFTVSSNHTALRGSIVEGDETKGLSLRFPRFIRKRQDKKINDATSPSELLAMYRLQEQRAQGLNTSSSTAAAPSQQQPEDDVDDEEVRGHQNQVDDEVEF